MEYQIFFAEHFKKQLKPYLKKYRRLQEDIIHTLGMFNKSSAVYLGAQTYKIRVRASDISKGKSHAFRMIVLVVEIDDIIAPVVLYFKGDRASITKKEIALHAKIVDSEIKRMY
ncbi:MAG: hypothetical protein Q8P78_00450 [bacterium]|nr:hypothetical protein [bacterium]